LNIKDKPYRAVLETTAGLGQHAADANLFSFKVIFV
jgi:hypothetical protein